MPSEPTLAGYCILAIGLSCYLVLAMLWHWTYGRPHESQDEIERRAQFFRESQRIRDREKIEEWKQYRESVKSTKD